ncbi:MAG: hypothetical protein V8Q30_11930 [Acutalibacteraceae bacterium]
MTMSDCELAYTSFDTPTRVFVCNRVELLNDGTIHPTQKPVKLYSWALSLFARKGMKILDTHAGSGSSSLLATAKAGLISSASRSTKIIAERQMHGLNRNKRKCGFSISWSRNNGKHK